MVKKIYEAKSSIITGLTIFVGKKPVSINFRPIGTYEGSHTGKGSLFETSDPVLQEAIEKCPAFGRRFFLFKTENINEVVKEEVKETTEDKGEMQTIVVSTPAEAREYLVENFGYAAKGLTRQDRINKAAAEHNIEFKYE